MEILYVDAMAGASGDMFLGALVDLGADFDALKAGLATLNVPGFRLERHATKRHQIAATKVDVVVEDIEHPHRHLRDLLAIIDAAPLSEFVKHTATHALTFLAEVEAHVHRMPLHDVHLHEVGGLDCLVDVVGTVMAVELLGAPDIFAGPVSVGMGHVKCAHGAMPLPAPGTLQILEGFPIRRTTIPHELTTPTGAALLVALAWPTTAPLIMVPHKVGYGAGSRDMPQAANLLRILRAEVEPRHLPPKVAPSGGEAHTHDHGHDHGHGHSHGDGHHHHHH